MGCLPRLEPVYSAVIALGLGSTGAALSALNGGEFVTAVEGLGGGANVLASAVWLVVKLGVLCTVVDLSALIIICASTFDCFVERLHVPHFTTTSRFLNSTQLAMWICFVVQTVLSQLVLVALVACALLLYVCDTDQSQQLHAQKVIDSLAAAPSALGYNPYGPGPGLAQHHFSDTPIVSVKAVLGGLNINRFCQDAGSEDSHGAVLVYLGSLLLAAAQAAMAAALASESERVAVHESAESVASAAKTYAVNPVSQVAHRAEASATTLLEQAEGAAYAAALSEKRVRGHSSCPPGPTRQYSVIPEHHEQHGIVEF